MQLVSHWAAQVFHLQQAGVECGYLSGSQDYEESRDVMSRLRADPPGLKILFVTPEKVAKSDALMRAFDALNARQQLARTLRSLCSSAAHDVTLQDDHVNCQVLFSACLSQLSGLSSKSCRRWCRLQAAISCLVRC